MKQLSEIDKQIEEEKKNIEILPTGLPTLDLQLDGGFLKKELIVLGGRTGGGKSIIAGNIFYNMAREGFRCAYFSLEISNQMIVSRLIGAKANLSPTRVMIAQLTEEEAAKKLDAKTDLAVFEEFMFFEDSIYGLPEIEKAIKAGDYDFVVIDFLQNVLFPGDEYERLSRIALTLQKLAKEANVCILALSQLSNQVTREKTKVDIVEYKGSGSIGTACDLGFFIEEGTKGPGSIVLRIRKNRRGISGIHFDFQLHYPGGKLVAL